ncbi:PREDICTED: circadian clock-controlled protein-like [Papilio xuthus]|uniref:Circadian clock-controlled protein-like n=1 Tax=Papilio xuthus TaxID=66420 RepID=A0AAJ7EDV0_PAPXU|nr:PREDICTED: circadian clock-controlled protein-like [Papilio xuthus]
MVAIMCSWKICLLSFCLLFELIKSSSNYDIKRCRKNDEICMIESASHFLKYISGGIPSLNIKSIDPIIANDFEGDSARLTYKFTNNSITGFARCDFNHIKLNLDLSTLLFDIKCPSLIIQGHYEVAGELVNLPLKRNGTYKVTTGLYFINFNTMIEKILGKDGKHHLAIQKHVVSGQPKEPIDFAFYRFTPDAVSSRQALVHFDQDRYKELHVLTRDAYRAAVFGPLFTYVNRFLATIPYDELFMD